VACAVWVTNGIYVLTSSVVIAKGITVRSVNGPDVTIVDGDYPARTNRCFFITGDAVVEGFTITNGYAYPLDDTPARTNVGGGLYLHECKAEIRNCVIVGNRAGTSAQGGRGGGMAIVRGAPIVRECRIVSNDTLGVGNALQCGTGLYIDGGRAWVERCVLSNNLQVGNNGYGAGMYVVNGIDVLVSNCVFVFNSASHSGGGAYFYGGTFTHCLFSNNVARNSAGGAYPYGYATGSRLFFSTVVNNRAGDGGGIAINRGIVSHCVVMRNSATSNGGGVNNNEGQLTNCLIAANTAGQRGGGLNRQNKNYSVSSCTIVRNYAGLEGGGVHNDVKTSQFTNNIVYWNYATNGIRNDVSGTTGAFRFSCALELTNGVDGNLTADPLFLDSGSGYGTNAILGDYRLQTNSPCVNAGTNQAWMAWPARDLEGQFRIRPFGGLVDMGVYEAYPAAGPLSVALQGWPTNGVGPLTVALYGETSGNTNGILWKWDFGDGTQSDWGSYAAMSHVYQVRTNTYTVTLWVTNAAGESAVAIWTNRIMVWPAIVYVALDGLHLPPFTNWIGAATNVQLAIDVAGPGFTTVLVAPGEYTVRTPIALNRAVVLKSASGDPSDTRLRGAVPAATSRVVTITAPGAWLEGFTITDGNSTTTNGGGISMAAAGVITNCAIVGNRATTGRGGGLEITAGIVVDCRIVGNQVAGTLGGGGVYLFGGSAIVRRCLIASNTAVSAHGGGVRVDSGTMEHCLIVHNQADGNGGGVLKTGTVTGVMRNCLVVGNQAGQKGGGAHVESGTLILENCTIVGNQADNGGGIWTLAQIAGTNCILVLNKATTTGGADDLGNTATNFVFSCSSALPHGTNGNVAADPRFVKSGQGYGLAHAPGDYRLRVGSPCVDAGIGLPWMANATDLAGADRIQNGLPDMGVYEGAVFVSPRGTFILIR
jgi:PKD repeat protein